MIILLILPIILMVLFHKFFHVTYFGFKGIVVEYFVFYIIGMVIVGTFIK